MPQPPKQLTPSNGALDLFGSEVRRYRERASLSIAALAELIPYSPSFVGAVERADSGCERGFAEAVDGVLDTHDALVHLHDGLFGKKSGAFPTWFEKWPRVEEKAGKLVVYQPLVIYGLLQTPEYANVVLGGDVTGVESRMKRQAVLTRDDPPPPRLVYVLPEHVLWLEKGGPDVMRAQLDRLVAAVASRASVQVIPAGVSHPGNDGAFVIATAPDGSETAYVETAARGIMLDATDDVSRLKDVFTDICTQALPVSMSIDLIERTNEERWKI
ncbi:MULTISPECIES: helix-turn-helix domain-containing protein [Actinomadura]|uniref:Helix-turn-helix domain-containing protein n=1 Tax=Actinomadura yumaensis TaxID=111807 RepID=A0ABW2CQY6_9ACTN|nr:helix-turn-helix transcriptional regulator [Actinomadura sp. J1-007]